MIPRQYRLKHMKDFEILFKEGRFVGSDLVTAKIWKIDPDKYPRRKYTTDTLLIGFVVSTKVSKSAVKRNRVKRRMREAVRLLLKEQTPNTGFLVLLIGKKECLTAEYVDIQRSVADVLKRRRIFYGN